MSSTEQDTFVSGPSGDNATLETDGRLIRPLLDIPASVVDEVKWRFDADGLTFRAVNKANVSMVKCHTPAAAFDTYTLEADGGFVAATNLSDVQAPLSSVRYGKQSADPVTLNIDRTRTEITSTRDYNGTTVERTDTVLNIDPDAVRQEPDSSQFSLPWAATIDAHAFRDVIKGFDQRNDYVSVKESDGQLVFSATGDDDDAEGVRATFDAELTRTDDAADKAEQGGGERSMFTLSYLKDAAKAIKNAYADEVTLRWGQEYPIRVQFERTDDDQTVYRGEYFLAPRIQSD